MKNLKNIAFVIILIVGAFTSCELEELASDNTESIIYGTGDQGDDPGEAEDGEDKESKADRTRDQGDDPGEAEDGNEEKSKTIRTGDQGDDPGEAEDGEDPNERKK